MVDNLDPSPRPAEADLELRMLRAVTRLLPPLPRATGVANRVVKPLYLRKPRTEVAANVGSLRLRLDPAEAIDGAYLFYPHLAERREMQHLRASLGPGDVFVDVGAHIGYYSLVAASVVGLTGTVIAIEPQSRSYARLAWNADANGFGQLHAVQAGVGARRERRWLGLNTGGNLGGSSFRRETGDGEVCEVRPLLDILSERRLRCVTGMKLDIEGDERTVLEPFLRDAPEALWPRWVLVEHDNERVGTPDDAVALLVDHGYRIRAQYTGNATNVILGR